MIPHHTRLTVICLFVNLSLALRASDGPQVSAHAWSQVDNSWATSVPVQMSARKARKPLYFGLVDVRRLHISDDMKIMVI